VTGVRSRAEFSGGPARKFDWFGQITFLVVMAGYVAAILVVTARRSRVAPATLAIGAGAGTVLGVVMYTVAPLGLSSNATERWLAGSAIDPVVAFAWILLLGGPVAAGGMAARRYRAPGSSQQVVSLLLLPLLLLPPPLPRVPLEHPGDRLRF
jgi:hypothetical protein